ncbi:hypothetical protein M9H77_18070 [Catharanthus roseus]|uniref:Uncharacterized protein n=1 Tax=Catharanthus roseus TaxID=4058 RepID=A0ACC0B6F6_CATRO|nr:hypothetical protein M9H77_18070 [Catharanthus roseus]
MDTTYKQRRNEQDGNANVPCMIITNRESSLMPVIEETSQTLHFGIETTNRAEGEHSVLKLWLSTCNGNLDIVFLNIDSLIEGQIAEIKSSLEYLGLKKSIMPRVIRY